MTSGLQINRCLLNSCGELLRRTLLPLTLIAILSVVVLPLASRGELPHLFVAEGGREPGRVLRSFDGGLESAFQRNRITNRKELRGTINSIEVMESTEVFFCSGEDGAIWKRSHVGEELVYISQGKVAQVRSERNKILLWSEFRNNDKDQWGIYRWDEEAKKPHLVTVVDSSGLPAAFEGAFEFRSNKLLIVVPGEKSHLFDITKPANYKPVTAFPFAVRSFRISEDAKWWTCDKVGRVMYFPDTANTHLFEVKATSKARLVDFDFASSN